MRKPLRDRAPAWCGMAAPTRWWVPLYLIGFGAGFVLLVLFDVPYWLPVVLGFIPAEIADWHWRRTRPPSADARWSPLARLLYVRRDPGSDRGAA